MSSAFAGAVEAIQISPAEGTPVQSVEAVEAVAGQGLRGDHHYADGPGPAATDPGSQLTLIAAEALAEASAELGEPITHAESRRNVLVAGVPLNDLVGETFRVGEVRVRGIRLCEPCRYLTELAGRPLLRPLVHRAGLNAEILGGGTIRVGDAVTVAEEVSTCPARSRPSSPAVRARTRRPARLCRPTPRGWTTSWPMCA